MPVTALRTARITSASRSGSTSPPARTTTSPITISTVSLRTASKRTNLTGWFGAPTNGATTPEPFALRRHAKSCDGSSPISPGNRRYIRTGNQGLPNDPGLLLIRPRPVTARRTARQPHRARRENFKASAIRHTFAHRSLLGKSPGDSLLFEQSALRGISYALTDDRPHNGFQEFPCRGSAFTAARLMSATIPLILVAIEGAVGRSSAPHDSIGPQPPTDVTPVDVP